MIITDTGENYIYEMKSGELKELEYGSILIRLGAVIHNSNMHAILNWGRNKRRWNVDEKMADTLISGFVKSTLSKEYEFLFDEDAVAQREIILEVMKNEAIMGEYDNAYEIINEKDLTDDIERILLGEQVDIDLINKLLSMGEIKYLGTYMDGVIVKSIELKTLGQLIAMEIENITIRKNPKIVFRRCMQCGRVFLTYRKAGNQNKLCDYKYSTGLCKKKRQKIVDDNRDPYEKIDLSIFEKMRKKESYNDVREGGITPWKEEYLNVMDPLKHTTDIEKYDSIARKTWKGILKKINAM